MVVSFFWMVIAATALFLILLAFIDTGRWNKRASENREPSHIEKVREAAFAVIEASLEAEPEKWRADGADNKVYWLINDEAGIALWIGNEARHLFVIGRDDWRDYPVNHDVSDRLWPPIPIRTRIFNLAKKIAAGEEAKAEADRLTAMVSAFGDIADRRKHDAATARFTQVH